jgi:hypothetical protein
MPMPMPVPMPMMWQSAIVAAQRAFTVARDRALNDALSAFYDSLPSRVGRRVSWEQFHSELNALNAAIDALIRTVNPSHRAGSHCDSTRVHHDKS